MPPLTTEEFELSSLRSELHSMESLLDDVLQRQSLLLSQLDCLQPPAPCGTEGTAVSDGPGPSLLLGRPL